jgi:phosphoserine aminotransferase
MEKKAQERASLLYQTLDSLPAFVPTVAREDRSLMNAVFVMKDPALENAFLEQCKQQGMVGVKGHRSVGGLRVSMYNALPLSSVEAFCELLKDFNSKHA